MKLKFYSLILFLLILSQSAHAANWQQISQYDYIDLDSISTINIEEHQNTKSIWLKSYNNGNAIFNHDMAYINERIFIDCKNNESTTKSLWAYDKNNNIVYDRDVKNNDLEWGSHVPGSQFDTISKYVCTQEDLTGSTSYNINSKQSSATNIYNNNVNSMVYIRTQDSIGSGVIVSEDGTLITCFHVIENADSINIKTHDGRTFKVNGFKYINPTEDVAILTIDAPYNKFKPIDINYNQLQIGEKVYTISNPKGLEFTFSDGMINQYKNEYIQFSAPISPGSSGGALLNEKGQLIGIITSYLGKAQNINFAIPNDYYVSKIYNLPIKNTYNQNWTKFLLSQTDNNQFKIKTDYSNIDRESYETYYNRAKYYADLPNYPAHLYAIAGYLAFYAYFETLKEPILNDAIKWYELSIINNQNVEVSLFALSMLYAMNDNDTKFEKCLSALYEQYPTSAAIIISATTNEDKNAGIETYIKHFEELSAKTRK